MKIFISYRRNDTAGRAGRLFDVLVTRFGARNVFQDVAAIEPGTDFTQRVDEAIAHCDVALVVIGSDWLTMQGPDGARRLDEPDDYVRREVGAALAAGVRVVPVLVDGAGLPVPEDLPEALRPLTHRQAVALRDATWHQDVDGLVRRLEGEDLIDAPRRRWPAVAAGAAALVIAVVAGAIVLRDGDDGDAESVDDDSPPECSRPDSAWSALEVPEGASAVDEIDGSVFTLTVESAHFRVLDAGQTEIIAQVEFVNDTPPADGTTVDDVYYDFVNFNTLLVDGLALGEPTCFSAIAGDQNVGAGQRAVGLVGFETTEELSGARLVLETDGENQIELTPSF